MIPNLNNKSKVVIVLFIILLALGLFQFILNIKNTLSAELINPRVSIISEERQPVDLEASSSLNEASKSALVKKPQIPTKKPTVKYIKHFITFYGWADNDPPGNGIAYPKSSYSNAKHEVASGIGTYADPITFASDPNLWPVGKIVYLPYLKKYAVMEDLCAGCVDNWSKKHIYHIDLWMQSDKYYKDKLLLCENKWTRNSIEVEINPPPNRIVDKRPLFNTDNGNCL